MNLNQILSKLISFETISETSNDEIASFIINFLNSYGIKSEKIKGDPGRFNIHSIIGPKVDGGIILSGHTDVVPTEGQLWSSNPFRLQKKGCARTFTCGAHTSSSLENGLKKAKKAFF